jgi:hypothetical protein
MSFSDETVQQVWEKGSIVAGYDPEKWRQDDCRAWIDRNAYGNRDTPYGWEIDHIIPESEGGGDGLSNLRPLQWKNNISKEAGRLKCVVSSLGNKNVRME